MSNDAYVSLTHPKRLSVEFRNQWVRVELRRVHGHQTEVSTLSGLLRRDFQTVTPSLGHGPDTMWRDRSLARLQRRRGLQTCATYPDSLCLKVA